MTLGEILKKDFIKSLYIIELGRKGKRVYKVRLELIFSLFMIIFLKLDFEELP